MAVTKQEVTEIYVATFNRAPDAEGLDYWVNDSFDGNPTIDQIAMSFFDQEETRALYPEGNTDEDFVTSIFNNLYNRDPDADGLAYWTGDDGLGGGMARSVMIQAVKNGATGTDAEIIANKAEVGLYYADTLELTAGDFSLEDVTDDDATVTTAKARAEEGVEPEPEPDDEGLSFDLIEETTVNDTSGYDTSYSNILDDILTLPDAQAGMLEPNQVQQAYLHIEEGESREFDHDTFVLDNLDAGTKYRVKITPDDPSNFQSNKISWLYDPSGELEDLIMNFTDGFFDGSLYSDTFTAQEDGDYFLSVSMRWSAGYGEYADGPEPYDIELIGALSTSVREIILPG
jgi:hypothetical protein